MSAEENKEGAKIPERERTEKGNGRTPANEPGKKQSDERNNSKRTGMPFGFDWLFFKTRIKF